jgi:hypothetical protein
MGESRIGRILVASLHQAIADLLPTRLDFYENWLSPTGLRDGRMGLAPLGAVLSFVQREEPPANRVIVAHAGACAADWIYDGTSAFRKRVIERLPLSLRTRAALGLGRTLVADTISHARVIVRTRTGQGAIEIRAPIFDYLRDASSMPMRRYYAAAYTECLRLCGVDGVVDAVESETGCHLTYAIRGAAAPPASV